MDLPNQRMWAIRYSNGWRYTDSRDSVDDARTRGLPVVEYTALGDDLARLAAQDDPRGEADR